MILPRICSSRSICQLSQAAMSLYNDIILNPQVLACLVNNTLEIWSLAVSPKDKEIECTSVQPLSAPGHTADVRCVSFSSDDTCIVSGSANELKVWNKASQQCIRTLPSGYALCAMVAPGDRHVFLGAKVSSLSEAHRILIM